VPVAGARGKLLRSDSHDKRWVLIRRPTVAVGGELTMDYLEIRHNFHTHVSEAPLQMKSNCGSLLIDDFGRQRITHVELLNRWIVPLEKHHDYLTLASGKKIQVPDRRKGWRTSLMRPRALSSCSARAPVMSP
jgi:predicted ATPase with chaperone activity